VIFGQVLNSIFSALTCWPIYLLAKKLFGSGIALASCWTWVLLPTAILFPLEWIWDQSLSALLLTALLCATLYLPVAAPSCPEALERGIRAARDSHKGLIWAAYGIGWAFALLTNPTVGLLLPVFLGWLAWQRHKGGAPLKGPIAIAVLTCVLGIVPWTARNYADFGHFVPIKSNFGLEFWLGNNPEVKRNWSPRNHPNNDSEQRRLLQQLGEMGYMKAKQREAVLFIEAHPGTFAKFCLGRLADTWTGNADVPWDRFIFMLHAGGAYLIFSSAFSVLALAGLVLASRSSGSEAAPLWSAVLVFPATYYATHTGLRYRHPIDPVLTVLATYAVAYAVSAVSNGWQARRTSRSTGSPDSLVAN